MVSLSLFSASEDVFEGADVGETAGDTEDVSEEDFVSDGAEDFVLEHPNAENEMRVSIAALSISFFLYMEKSSFFYNDVVIIRFCTGIL